MITTLRFDGPLVSATFLERPNRFLTVNRLEDGAVVRAHLADPGRLTGLLVPGMPAWLTPRPGTHRVTQCDLTLSLLPFLAAYVILNRGQVNNPMRAEHYSLEDKESDMANLIGRRVAILVESNYEDLELWYPLLRLREAGAEVTVIAPQAGTYASRHGYPVEVNLAAGDANPANFDGVVVPGGWSPDRLRRYASVTNFVKALYDAGKMVAAICHGPHVLVSAKVVYGHKMTAVVALKDDLINAGATFVDAEVVRDGNLITSRTPDDLPAFMREVLTVLGAPFEKMNARDVLHMAIEGEKDAYTLYDLAAQRSTNLETKALFRRLAEEEARHRGTLEADLEQLDFDPVWGRYDGWREVA